MDFYPQSGTLTMVMIKRHAWKLGYWPRCRQLQKEEEERYLRWCGDVGVCGVVCWDDVTR